MRWRTRFRLGAIAVTVLRAGIVDRWLGASDIALQPITSLPLLVNQLTVCLYHFKAVMLVVNYRLHGSSGINTSTMATTDTC